MTDPAMALVQDNIAEGEDRRLKALERYDILDTPKEQAFERIASLVQLIFGVDTSLVSMIDGHRQWYKASRGMTPAEVPITETFCRFTMAGGDSMVVNDATLDARFRENPHVTGAKGSIRFYASSPMKTPEGYIIGTLCAIDSRPREFSGKDVLVLEHLAAIAMDALELRQLATTDGLTGCMTRRAFKEEGARMVANARRHRRGLACIAFDVDHFKKINDTYGHAAGDAVLKALSKTVGETLREGDLFGRLGGEEFAVLASDVTASAAAALAERLRVAFRALKFPGSRPPITISASFGVAGLDHDGDDIESLLGKADEAEIDAKRQGRNRTVLWTGEGSARRVVRRRVLKAGRLIFNNRHSVTDCTVRSLWDTGAEVDVSSTAGIPDDVTLGIRSDNAEWRAQVSRRGETTLELQFV
jgi:diguanylate cyclase (GGDEF)-like protein